MKKNHIKLPFFLLFFIFILTDVRAQEAVVANGGSSSGSGGSMSYSVGQIAYTTATGVNGTASQGVQQPYEFFVVGIDGSPDINLQLTVYPNPTNAKVTLNIGSLKPKGLNFYLFDATGKLLNSQVILSELTVVPMENLQPGTYVLKVSDGKSELRSFKIIKK
jgi:hypothetical protein